MIGTAKSKTSAIIQNTETIVKTEGLHDMIILINKKKTN
jgi:hypothetical protein